MNGLENTTLGKYEMVRPVGQGNMGTVYLARDPFGLRDVAVKVALPDPEDNERSARRRRKLFYTEAKAMAMLKHPHIIETIDAGFDDGMRFIVMEFVPEACTLRQFCQPTTLLPMERAVTLMLQCALAISYAHSKGVVHRDIKPSNVLLTQDKQIKIVDFGSALMLCDTFDATQVIGSVGSPRYMSPEQIRGETTNEQSDIFSLGTTFYELVVGRNPFSAKSVPEIARRILREPFIAPSRLRDGVPEALERVLERTLKKHPAGRYSTAIDLAGDLSLIHDELVYDGQRLGGHRLDELRGLMFFEDFEDQEILEFVKAGVWRRFEKNKKVIVEGSIGDAFYVLISGAADVYRNGQRIGTLEPGVSFGEMGFLDRPQRTATIVARERSEALRVERTFVDQLSLGCQLRFQRAVMRAMSQRLSIAMQYIEKHCHAESA